MPVFQPLEEKTEFLERTRELRETLKREFSDPEYRYAYAEDFLNTCVATQIKVIREQRGMTQQDLALAIGTQQAGISRLENVNYSAWKTETLRKIAHALGVRLKITFEPFGTLLDEASHFSREALQRPDFEHDVAFQAIQPETPTRAVAEALPNLSVNQTVPATNWDRFIGPALEAWQLGPLECGGSWEIAAGKFTKNFVFESDILSALDLSNFDLERSWVEMLRDRLDQDIRRAYPDKDKIINAFLRALNEPAASVQVEKKPRVEIKRKSKSEIERSAFKTNVIPFRRAA